jgi:apolipoprotein N-acyltransferase
LIYIYIHDIWTFASNSAISKKIINKKLGFIVLAIFLPLCLSWLIYHKENINIPIQQSVEALIIQQNTDPHEEQYRMSNAQHVQRLMEIAQTKITPQTQLMICSESAIPHDIPLLALFHFDDPRIKLLPLMQLDTFLMQYPQLNIIAGVSTIGFYDFKPSATARNIDEDVFQEDFNSSMLINQEGVQGVYHKSRLVPGVEIMPYPAIFGFLGKMMVNLGGRVTSLGTDSCQHVFSITQNGENINIGVPICYESIYGEVFSQFVKNGANLMCVITNDGWWKNTPGHQQHFIYAKLRAIETRKTILRAANTGISAVINPMGKIVTQTKYNERTAILEKVSTNSKLTFYVKHGDYLARISLIITVLLFIYVFVRDNAKKIMLAKRRKK